jgi:hypothetical protein
MADTQEQIQYDKDLAQLNATPKSSIGTAAWNQLKKAFDAKYPMGLRPGSTTPSTTDPTTSSTAVGSDKGTAPGTAWIYDDATKKWVKPVQPVKGNKIFTWDDDKGWVESGVNTTGLTVGIGFVLTKALLEDPIYGIGKGGLQEVYDLWAAGDETAALDAYFKSNYYLKLGRTAAARYVTSKNQPDVYAADEAAYISEQTNRLFKLGVRVDDAELIDLLKKAYSGNLTISQLDASIAASNSFGGKFGGTILTSIQEFKNLARSYGLSYTEAKYNQWGADLFANKITDSEIEEAIKTESASKYPAFADKIMKGVTMDALASSYKSSMASILSLDADSIGYDDPTLNKALQYIGPDGKPVSKPLWEFESDLRADPRWQFTDNARDTVDSLQYKVLKDWGLI